MKTREKWSLTEHGGRRAWAFLALLGGSGVMTAFAAYAMWLVRAESKYVFWLGIAAHAQIAVCLTGFMALFVKREVSITREGVTVKDNDNVSIYPQGAEQPVVRGSGDRSGDSAERSDVHTVTDDQKPD